MYILKTAAAHMPASCRGHYKRIAIIELKHGFTTCSMISERAKGVKRIVRTWEALNFGKSKRCAYQRAMVEATAMLFTLMVSERGHADDGSDL